MLIRSNNSGFLGQTIEIYSNAKFLMNKKIFRLLVNKINTLLNCRNVSSFVKVGSLGQEVTWADVKLSQGLWNLTHGIQEILSPPRKTKGSNAYR